MATSHLPKNGPTQRSFRNRVARAVFDATRSAGIADRELADKLTEGVIQRLERTRPLPGMEDLVPKLSEPDGRHLPTSQIKSIVQEILAQGKATEVAKAPTPLEKKRRQPRPKVEVSDTKISANALAVLERRYLTKDGQGQVIETPEDMFRRVAHNIASAELIYNSEANVEQWEQEFYELMANLEFLPNSPTLMNAGRDLQQLSACFVLPIEDSMESIFDAVKHTALIHKSGGGTGFSFSRLRPESDRVGSTGGVASGPVSFMRAFDTATDVIKQGGMRRGANMAILNVDHPDILKFITAKENDYAFNNFNLSVAVTKPFMEAVESGADYELVNPRTKEVAGKLNAKEVFGKIVDMAWRNGDPGIVFLDRINDDNPTKNLGDIESTNPCGEQPLLPYESCNLGSINLSKMVSNDDIDWPKLEKVVKTAARFLDNVIEVNKFPLPEIEEMTKATRKIGLGVMGFADMLIKLDIPYDSEEALDKAEDIMQRIQKSATEASVELAKERGVFPAFKGSIYDVVERLEVRNATRTTIAPTGTLSIIANCSSGIEPLFALSYTRQTRLPESEAEAEKELALTVVNPLFEEIAQREGFYSQDLIEALANGGSIRDMEGIPERVKKLFVTAHDISPECHIRMQAAFQKSTKNAVSKTVNFPHDATREDVAQVFKLAYKEGCKGVTIYRDRSRDEQVLSIGKGEQAGIFPRARPRATIGRTEKVATGCGNLYITINSDEQGICEVFSSLGKAGGCASAQLEAASRLISLALRSGVDLESIINQLRGIRCPSIAWDQGQSILSCPDAIGNVLASQLSKKETKKNPKGEAATVNLAGQCPDCSGLLVYQEGCLICPFCGYTKC